MVVGWVFYHGMGWDFLGGQDYTDARVYTHVMQAFAHHCRQGTGVTLGDVGGMDLRWIESASAAHGTDRGDAETVGMVEQKHFG